MCFFSVSTLWVATNSKMFTKKDVKTMGFCLLPQRPRDRRPFPRQQQANPSGACNQILGWTTNRNEWAQELNPRAIVSKPNLERRIWLMTPWIDENRQKLDYLVVIFQLLSCKAVKSSEQLRGCYFRCCGVKIPHQWYHHTHSGAQKWAHCYSPSDVGVKLQTFFAMEIARVSSRGSMQGACMC